MSEGVIGPYFFKNDDGTIVTINSAAIEEYDLENMWFQQGDATYHTTPANMALLQETFPGRVISLTDDIN